jgi:hypothetical protein
MSLFKSADPDKHGDSSMSLLKGLFILAILGIVAAIVVNQFIG